MFDWIADAWSGLSNWFSSGTDALGAADAALGELGINTALEAGAEGAIAAGTSVGDIASGFATGASAATPGLWDRATSLYKTVNSDPLMKTGLTAGLGALTNRSNAVDPRAFNQQLSGLVEKTNTTVQAPTPAPVPGLSGSRGAVDPKATIAGASRPAPTLPSAGGVSGTPSAPNNPESRAQTGAVKLGTRPQMYGGG